MPRFDSVPLFQDYGKRGYRVFEDQIVTAIQFLAAGSLVGNLDEQEAQYRRITLGVMLKAVGSSKSGAVDMEFVNEVNQIRSAYVGVHGTPRIDVYLQRFRAHYQLSEVAERTRCRERLHAFRQGHSAGLREHLEKWLELRRDCDRCGYQAEPDEFFISLLTSLDHHYITAASHPALPANTEQYLVERLRSLQVIEDTTGHRHGHFMGFNQQRGRGGGLQGGSRADKKKKRRVPGHCHRCGETGHWKSDCRVSETVECRVCGQTGHLPKACPTRSGRLAGRSPSPSRLRTDPRD